MNKRLRLGLIGGLLLVVGYLTGNPAAITTGTASVMEAVQE